LVNNFFAKIFGLGIDKQTNFTTAKKVKLLNSMSFMVIVSVLLHAIMLVIFNPSWILLFHPTIIALFIGVLILNKRKSYQKAVYLLFGSFIFAIFIFGAYSFFTGQQNVSKYAIIPFSVLIFFFLETRKLRFILFWICAIGFIVINYFQQFLVPAPHTTYWAVMLMIFLSFYLCLRLFLSEHTQYQMIVEAKNIEMESANTELNHQKEFIEKALTQLTDSVKYAKRIQQAILPNRREIHAFLTDSFVFYQPKGIVSGDFYWFHQLNESQAILAASDCTGHGVPGAFMTIIGNNLLQQIVVENHITDPKIILTELDKKIISLLVSDETTRLSDGMDIALCFVDKKNKKVVFSGAQRPILVYTCDVDKQPVIHEVKGDKFPIGGYSHQNKLFTNVEFDLKYGGAAYLFTDGITDLFGGNQNKKLGLRRLREWLEDFQTQNFSLQKDLLTDKLDDWQGNQGQIDDMLLIGFHLK